VTQQDVAEFLSEDLPSFLLRGEPVAAVEDDRTLAGDVDYGAAHPVDEDTFNHRNAGKVDDRLHIYWRLLAGESQQPSRPTAGELIAYFTTFW
jgi:hypothetical protein